MHVKELTTIDEMLTVYDVQAQMYTDMTRAKYEEIIPQRIADGYRMLGVFDGDTCICTAGFWIGVRFYCGKFIQLDNMVADEQHRAKGAGKAVVDWIKELGKKEGCNRILIDTYVENFDAHRFFYREGFIIRGYHLNYTL